MFNFCGKRAANIAKKNNVARGWRFFFSLELRVVEGLE
jgi:hypothetical protein